MAELTSRERLQPSLLDRLTDDSPQSTQETRDHRVLSMRQYRTAVLRDLGWLLNARSHQLPGDNFKEFPEVERSVLNFGVPDFTGGTASSVDPMEMERVILQAIRDFEPRIIRQSLSIRVKASTEEYSGNALTFEIEGDLWAQPFPEAMYIQTEMDLESGQCKIENRIG